MKKFLKKCTLWLFILASAIICMILLVINIYHKDYYNLTKKADKKSFLMADSHGLRVNLNKINTDNLSYGSNSYVDIKNQLSWLVKKKKVDTLLLTYDEQMFSSYRDRLNNNYLSYMYDPIKLSEFKVSYITKFLTLFQRMVDIKLREFFLRKKVNSEKKLSDESFFDIGKQERIRRAKKRIAKQYLEESPTQKSAFNHILNFCKDNNVELFLIKFPLSQEYLNERNLNKNYIGLKKTNNNFPVLDFSTSILNSKFYRDQDHLNEDGLKILEKLIVAEVKP
jgi:hypothetical protein